MVPETKFFDVFVCEFCYCNPLIIFLFHSLERSLFKIVINDSFIYYFYINSWRNHLEMSNYTLQESDAICLIGLTARSDLSRKMYMYVQNVKKLESSSAMFLYKPGNDDIIFSMYRHKLLLREVVCEKDV